MPIKTQMRLGQITGSLGTTGINDQITAAATGSIGAPSIETVLSHLAGAIKRIHGDDSFSESAAGEFHQDIKLNSTNKLQFTDSGMFIHGSADGQLHLESDGNSADAINITTSNAAGGIDIDAGTNGVAVDTTGAFSIDATGTATASNITHAGADGQDLTINTTASSLILQSAEATTDAIRINASGVAAGIDVDANGVIDVQSRGNTTVHSAGLTASDNTLLLRASNTNLSGEGLVTVQSEGTLLLSGEKVGTDSIHLQTAAGGGIDIDAGSAGLTIDSAGVLSIDATDDLNLTVTSSTDGEDLTISQIGGNDSSVIITAAGTGTDAIKINSTAGSIDIDSADNIAIDAADDISLTTTSADGLLTLHSAHTAGQAILIDANAAAGSILDIDAGIIDIDVQDTVSIDAADEIEITTTSADGHIQLTSAHTAGIAFKIDANASVDAIVDIDAGILQIDADGAASIESGGTLSLGTANSGVAVNIGHSTSEVTIGDNLTVTGDLTVSGDTITLNTTNLAVEDRMILLHKGNTVKASQANGTSAVAFSSGSNTANEATIFGAADVDVLAAARMDVTNGTANPSYTNLVAMRGSQFQFTNANNAIGLNGSDLQIAASGDMIFDADGADFIFKDSGVSKFEIDVGSAGTINHKILQDSQDIVFNQFDGNEVVRIADDRRLYFFDKGGEYIVGNGSNLEIHAGTDLELKADANHIKMTSFTGEIHFISGSNNELGRMKMREDIGALILSASGEQSSLVLDSGGMIIFGQEFDGAQGAGVGARINSDSNFEGIQFTRTNEQNSTHYGFKLQIHDNYASSFAAVSGSLRLYEANNAGGYVEFKSPSLGGGGNAYSLTFPTTNGNADQVLSTDGNGVLNWVSQGGASNSSKTVQSIQGTVNAGTNASGDGGFAAVNTSALTEANAKNNLDVYVNGQLLVSSSVAFPSLGASSAGDYAISGISASTDFRFTFPLEADDVVTVVVRA